MARINKYGVSDYIPAEVKREIRQRCGFGCVVCGSPFYDYEHWNLEFNELHGEHSADGITLCCPNCHRKKGGLLSLKEYYEYIKNPKALSDGFVKTKWTCAETPRLLLGNVECLNINKILVVDNIPIIAFLKPEVENAPPRLIARFFDRSGIEQFRIDHNECIGNSSAWDITSNKINENGWNWKVRKAIGEVDLDLSIYPPDRVEVNSVRMQFGTLQIRANERGFQVLEMTSDKGLINRFYISGGSVNPNSEDHVFFGVDRTFDLDYARRVATVKHHFKLNNVTLVGNGGVFSLAEDVKFI